MMTPWFVMFLLAAAAPAPLHAVRLPPGSICVRRGRHVLLRSNSRHQRRRARTVVW